MKRSIDIIMWATTSLYIIEIDTAPFHPEIWARYFKANRVWYLPRLAGCRRLSTVKCEGKTHGVKRERTSADVNVLKSVTITCNVYCLRAGLTWMSSNTSSVEPCVLGAPGVRGVLALLVPDLVACSQRVRIKSTFTQLWQATTKLQHFNSET